MGEAFITRRESIKRFSKKNRKLSFLMHSNYPNNLSLRALLSPDTLQAIDSNSMREKILIFEVNRYILIILFTTFDDVNVVFSANESEDVQSIVYYPEPDDIRFTVRVTTDDSYLVSSTLLY